MQLRLHILFSTFDTLLRLRNAFWPKGTKNWQESVVFFGHQNATILPTTWLFFSLKKRPSPRFLWHHWSFFSKKLTFSSFSLTYPRLFFPLIPWKSFKQPRKNIQHGYSLKPDHQPGSFWNLTKKYNPFSEENVLTMENNQTIYYYQKATNAKFTSFIASCYIYYYSHHCQQEPSIMF